MYIIYRSIKENIWTRTSSSTNVSISGLITLSVVSSVIKYLNSIFKTNISLSFNISYYNMMPISIINLSIWRTVTRVRPVWLDWKTTISTYIRTTVWWEINDPSKVRGVCSFYPSWNSEFIIIIVRGGI